MEINNVLGLMTVREGKLEAMFVDEISVRSLRSFGPAACRSAFHIIIVAGLSALIVCFYAVAPLAAKSFAEIFIEVDSVQIWVEVDADPTMSELVDASQVRERVFAYLSAALSAERPDISLEPPTDSGMGVPELRDINRGTLAVVLSLTVRKEVAGSNNLPCCLGALSMRLDRDAFRRRQIAELIYSEDRYRMNWPPEPLFLGGETRQATERVTEASVKLLEKVVEALVQIPPN